jgi:hypothetical protein
MARRRCLNRRRVDTRFERPSTWASIAAERRAAQEAPKAVTGVYDEAGNVIETHEHAGDFKE